MTVHIDISKIIMMNITVTTQSKIPSLVLMLPLLKDLPAYFFVRMRARRDADAIAKKE